MARRKSASSAPGKRAAKSAAHIPDREIDFSDIPESTDRELTRARRVGRSSNGRAGYLMAVRLTPRLLASLRRLAAKKRRPCDVLIPELLKQAMRAS